MTPSIKPEVHDNAASDPAAQWQQADLVVMKLFLERVDVVGDGSLRGEGAAGVGEPRDDAVE